MIIVSPNNSVQGVRLLTAFLMATWVDDSNQTLVEMASSDSRLWSQIGHGLLGTK